MNKELRMKNTEYYEYTNVNPKGKYGGDCVVRAIAFALNQTWEQTICEMTELGIKMGFVLNDRHVYEKYLANKGWAKCPEPRDVCNRKMSVKEWINENQVYTGTYIIHAGSHHVSCVSEGKVRDIWNCSRETMHTYWGKLRCK